MSIAPKPFLTNPLDHLLRSDVAQLQLSERIVSVLARSSDQQLRELQQRNSSMQEHAARTTDAVLEQIAKHHCAKIMRERAAHFRQSFSKHQRILDLGGGSGWYWQGTSGAPVVLVDFSLESLKVAERLLKPADDVTLLHCDATALPFQPQIFDGLFSVQVLQHMQIGLLKTVCSELSKVLRPSWRAELYALHAPLLHRAVYALLGRRYHRSGQLGDYFLTREPPAAWRTLLSELFATSGMSLDVSVGYSELFFHPNFGCMPRRYPDKLERLITQRLTGLAALIARQHQLYIEGKKVLYS